MKITAFIKAFSLTAIVVTYAGTNCLAENAPTQNQTQSQAELQQKVKRLQEILAKVQQPAGQNATAQLNQTQIASQPTSPAGDQQNLENISLPAAEDPGQPPSGQSQVKTEPPSRPDLYEEAFTGVINQLMPISPEQITHLKGAFNEAQRAAAAPAGIPPRPTSSSIVVNLAPHATPPIIRLQAGYISSLVFMDSTGQPWPIAAYSLGDPTAFNIQWDKKGNTLLVQSLTFYKRSNIAVILKELNTPVMLTLLPGQEAVDYRVDLRIPGVGPNTVLEQNGLPESTNPILVDVLNGIPPPNSISLNVSGGDCQAWLSGNKLFLRTNLDVISPAFRAKISSIDGMHAFEVQKSPRILVLQRGKIKTLKIDGI